MMKQMRKGFFWAVMLLGTFFCLPAFAQEDEEPMMVIKSRVYEASNGQGIITLTLGAKEDCYIDVDCGYGAMEYEVSAATLDSETGTIKGTQVACNVSKEGIIRIYGDANKIDVFSASECYLTEVQMEKLTNLEILDISNNELTQLDLSPHSALQSINVSGNPFNVKPLLIGGNKPGLVILDMGRIDRLDESFNLSDYPALMSFDAWANAGLKKLDPTGCPDLRKISIDSTPVEELDVTRNTRLTILNISDTRIRNIDLSKNLYLNQFYCDHMSGSINPDVKLEKLDVTHNPNLVYLFASGNGFTDLDVTKNPELQDLYVNNNRLTSLDLSKNPKIYNLSIRNNNFTFATLPLPNENWFSYAYQQNTMDVGRSQKVGAVIDLSDKVLREGTTTTAVLYRTSESDPNSLVALSADYYTYEDGKVTLLKALTDSVYVAFSNDAFPESAAAFYPLCTNKFMIKSELTYGQDDKAFSFVAPVMSSEGTAVRFGLGMLGASAAHPKTFYVDYGKGKVECTATSESAPAEPNAEGVTNSGTVVVYVPEGELVSAFDMEDVMLNSIDLKAARSLRSLRLVNAGLYGSDNIDLSWNRMLASLELTGNHFTSLNIRGVNDAYQKNLLTDINLSNNELTTITLNDMRTIHNLNLSHNKLTELSLTGADNMLTLDVSDNQLQAVNINYCTLMTSLNIARNNISSLVLPATVSLKELHCEYNAFDFNTLPVIEGLETYTFIPQNDILIGKIGPGVDLSVYNRDEATTYVWKKADGTPLQKGVEYTEEGGVTHFLAPSVGAMVYCEMSNSHFEGLVLKTSQIEAAAMPSHVIASFVTTADQKGRLIMRSLSGNTPLYIDWSGTEADLVEYQVGTSPQQFEVSSKAGATVRVYTYAETNDISVFSLDGLSLASIDVTPMTSLVLFGAQNAGLTEDAMKLPDTDGLKEFRLAGNNFSHLDLTRYAQLYDLDLTDNKFTTFDASVYPELQLLSIANNQLTSFISDNSKIWHLDLAYNALTDIDLSRLPNMNQMSLMGNRLSHIDVSKMPIMKVLYLDRNRFKPSTLPLNTFMLYTCANQEPIDIQADQNGVVDLSSEAVINGKETVFRWFVGMPDIDTDGSLVGEELYIDDEYTLENGVTTFTAPIDDVVCVLTNEEFPNVYFYTKLIDVTTGINDVAADGNGVSVVVDGRDICVSTAQDATVRLVGVNGMQVRMAKTVDGACTLGNVPQGAYVLLVGKSAYKIVVR